MDFKWSYIINCLQNAKSLTIFEDPAVQRLVIQGQGPVNWQGPSSRTTTLKTTLSIVAAAQSQETDMRRHPSYSVFMCWWSLCISLRYYTQWTALLCITVLSTDNYRTSVARIITETFCLKTEMRLRRLKTSRDQDVQDWDYCKTLIFRCVLISRFWSVENLQHFNFAFWLLTAFCLSIFSWHLLLLPLCIKWLRVLYIKMWKWNVNSVVLLY